MTHDNAMLAVTGNGLKSTDFRAEYGFYPADNNNLDAPAFFPTGSTWNSGEGNNVVMPRAEMWWQ